MTAQFVIDLIHLWIRFSNNSYLQVTFRELMPVRKICSNLLRQAANRKWHPGLCKLMHICILINVKERADSLMVSDPGATPGTGSTNS